MCTAHTIWYMVTHYIGPCGCLQVSNWLNSVGYKAERVKKWHVENVTDHFFLLLFFLGEFLKNLNEVKVLLTYLLTYAWWGWAKQSARILTSVVVNWSRRKSRSFSSVSRFRVAVERFFSRSAWASSMSYSNITLAFGGTIVKQYQWQR